MKGEVQSARGDTCTYRTGTMGQCIGDWAALEREIVSGTEDTSTPVWVALR